MVSFSNALPRSLCSKTARGFSPADKRNTQMGITSDPSFRPSILSPSGIPTAGCKKAWDDPAFKFSDTFSRHLRHALVPGEHCRASGAQLRPEDLLAVVVEAERYQNMVRRLCSHAANMLCPPPTTPDYFNLPWPVILRLTSKFEHRFSIFGGKPLKIQTMVSQITLSV